jgi:iron complex outermembrane recepter protein
MCLRRCRARRRAGQAEPAAADAASAPGGEALQEIVVTATKRSEDLQNIGLSITALTTEQLESKGVEQFFDYGNSIPNLSFAIDSADGSLAARGIALRGIQGSNTTGFYIDDIPVLETLDPHIVDVARIEVLRGPQGTLYGAESMGGTVRIITAQPTADRVQRTGACRYVRHRPRFLERDRGRRRQPASR